MPWISRTWLMAAWIGFLFFSIPSATHALLGTIETELGYDSNPGLVYSNEKGSAFTILSGDLAHGFAPSPHTLLTIGAGGMGRRYTRDGARESIINLHVDLSYINSDGTFQHTIFARAAFLRSDLVPEDDRDVVGAGASLEYYPGVGLGIAMGISFDWLDFRRHYTPAGNRAVHGKVPGMARLLGALGSMSGFKSAYGTRNHGPMYKETVKPGGMPYGPMEKHNHMQPFHRFSMGEKKRKDRYEAMYFSIEKDLFQYFTTTVTLMRERLFASIKYEGFMRYGAIGAITVSLPKNIDLTAGCAWKRARFRKTSLGNRTDYSRQTVLELSKSYKKFGISIGYEHLTNDSSLEIEDYRKNLARLRFGFYF